MTTIIDYLILFLVALVVISLPDIYAVYSGVHLDRTLTLIGGLAVIYAVVSLQMRSRRKRNGSATTPNYQVVVWILVCGIGLVLSTYLIAPFIIDAIWPVVGQ
jgi:uncharacterized YccA/Bax inhibitor family protein